jgi:mannosyltransferase OCH1-like enzyme
MNYKNILFIISIISIIIIVFIIYIFIISGKYTIYNIKKYKYYYDLSYPNNYYNNSKKSNIINSNPNSIIPSIIPIIPLYIFQTWHTKNLSEEMQETVNIIKRTNPEFTYILADDSDCYNFIKNNFPSEVADAYISLIPGAYKADLWRYCVLYKYGGIYLDIKFRPVNGFKFINIMDKEHYVLDIPSSWISKQYGIYNGFMICKRNNPILMECINQIILNIKNNFYGINSLEPTGPLLLGSIYNLYNDITDIDICLTIKYKFRSMYKSEVIIYKNMIILEIYKSYRSEQKKDLKNLHYSTLWNNKQIYQQIYK